MKYLFALPLTLALLAGCFGAFPVQPGVPTNLQASEDQGDAINLTWIAVPAAGAYLIYRDGAAAAYATSQIAAYRDTDVEAERQYSYRVSALDIYGQLESAQSDSDIGSTYGFSWQAAQSLASGVLTYSAAAGGGSAYAAWSLTGGSIVIKRWDVDQKAWLDFSSPGSWVGGSRLTLGFQSQSLLCAYTGTSGLCVMVYNNTDKVWEARGTAGFATPASARLLLAADNTYTYLAFNSGDPAIWRYGTIGGWAELDLSLLADPALLNPSLEALALNSGAPFIAVAHDTGVNRVVSTYRFATTWQATGFMTGLVAGPVAPTVGLVAQGSAIYAPLRLADNTVRLAVYDQGVWADLTPTGFAGGNLDPVLVYHRQAAHLLQAAPAGAVLGRRYQDEAWYYAGANGATGIAAADSLQAVSLNDRLFVLSAKDGALSVSIYE
ncbi:MAG: hypothetical protein A2087_04980 [Spirochaetes bacterium GWD1_61_31]|nr:MAG: hypothetical protein A2Y37_01480 [Spirochaetes bacterium GWB1_60_80]OHD34888.1 MAG: hypothetical protein A2004_00510 [Spirochaetes bacterium GWC1_61_12]OHD37082.1 MAG: hypothetical protein A2087_04980 [Spirochaetes bacterium GWD1_61_31]OHD44653.1 MAG: hypothetical protein A2Y35_11820 [Spirochaetes bacterium GWE1_60_18]OHD61059.1 MAG: hypothetical protein A2Y32_09095 [Spirochaetes bacterium GWF1_60_12]HAP42717.1 hypothetical protein [Spirochaetaceae bacterium]